MSKKKFYAADLFCGAGGTSTGLALACQEMDAEVDLVAINHWERSLESHKANHPWARHYCKSLGEIKPRDVIPGGKLDILIAAPECTYHSNARGGKPINDQMRMSAWHVVDWLSELYVRTALIENVPEFRDWGPVDSRGHKIKKRRGEIYRAFITAIKSHGYHVEWRIINAADHGDATTRERLFIICRRVNKKIAWPKASHDETGMLTGNKWRAAREVIDWTCDSQSIFTRKRPLAETTMARIEMGLRRFGGVEFILPPLGFYARKGKANKPRSLDQPMQTITATHGGGHLVQPCLINMRGTSKSQIRSTVQSVDEPVPTLTTAGHVAIAQPELKAFVLPHRTFDNMKVDSIERPLRTIVGMNGRHFGLVEPLVVNISHTGANGLNVRKVDDPLYTPTTQQELALVESFLTRFHGNHAGKKDGENRNQSVDEPVGTLDTSNRYGLVQAFTVPAGGPEVAPRSTEEPMNTVLTRDHMGLVQPYVVPFFGERDGQAPRTHSIEEPVPAVTSHGAGALVEPHLVHVNHGEGDERRVHSVDEPIPTLTTKNGLAIAEGFLVKYYGTAGAVSVDEPLDTITSKDRFGLVQYPIVSIKGQLYLLDIRFRMLKPHELAAAMSFPPGYVFTGTLEQQVKQIGNAVAVQTAKALVLSILGYEEQQPKAKEREAA